MSEVPHTIPGQVSSPQVPGAGKARQKKRAVLAHPHGMLIEVGATELVMLTANDGVSCAFLACAKRGADEEVVLSLDKSLRRKYLARGGRLQPRYRWIDRFIDRYIMYVSSPQVYMSYIHI